MDNSTAEPGRRIHWEKLCGAGKNFTIWNEDDFGQCFQQLAIVALTHMIFALTSIYHTSKHHDRRIRGSIPHTHVLYVRLSASVLLMISPILIIFLSLYLEEVHPSFADIATWVVRAIAWLIHSGFVWKLRRYYHLSMRGPVVVIVTFQLTTTSIVVELRTVIAQLIKHTEHVNVYYQYMILIMGVFHIIYVVTLFFRKRPSLADSPELNIQAGEQQHIETSQSSDYGTIPNTDQNDLGVAEDNRNCMSKLSFWWVLPLMLKGYNEKLEHASDLFWLPRKLQTERIDKKFSGVFKNDIDSNGINGGPEPSVTNSPHAGDNGIPDIEIRNATTNTREAIVHSSHQPKHKVTLLGACHKVFGKEYYLLGLLKFFADGLNFAGPILLNHLVSFISNKTEPMWHGYLYAALLLVSTLIGSLASTHFNYMISVVGLKIRAAIITTVYHKTMSVSSVSLSSFSSGQVVNFMSTDTDRIVNFCPSFHQFWSLPVQVGVALFLLYQQVGLAFLAGLGFALILIPINRWLAIKIGQLSTDMMHQKDARVKVMNEILYGIRVIKFYAWEEHFLKKISVLRKKELKSLKGRKYLDAMCVYFWATSTVLMSILTFTTYVLLGGRLTAAKVFTSMALFNILITPLNAFPWVLNGLMEAWVSIKRLQEFLKLDDIDPKSYFSKHSDAYNSVICIANGHFSWGSHANTPEHDTTENSSRESHVGNGESVSNGEQRLLVEEDDHQTGTLKLTEINVDIKKGHLVGVIGKVGSGKSSLFSAILGEMLKDHGFISTSQLNKGFGLFTQEAWIQHATLRDNILFGEPYVRQKYEGVLEGCALLEDLKILPGGDMTEIGENGVTLSGGQKARVALARAVYQDKSVYLLDDPLAAVDAHVAQHLFEECIMGLLKSKTRILCTHHTKYLKDADMVVVIEDGKVVKCGKPEDMLSTIDLEATTTKQKKENPDEDESQDIPPNMTADGTLVQEEEKDTGVVKLHVYHSYWKAVGKCLSPVVLISLFLMQASRNINDWWLSFWVSHSNSTAINSTIITQYGIHVPGIYDETQVAFTPPNGNDIKFYLGVYGILAAANSVFTFARAFLFAYGGLCAAYVVHDQLLDTIMKAPINFFDTTPIGRVINRFSSDMYSVDDTLPFIMNIFFASFFGVLGTIAVTCYGLPWFTIVLVPLAAVYFFIQRYYRYTSREIKRITSVTLSPIYAHFSESLSGLTVIRAFRHSHRFKQENKDRLDLNQRAQFAGVAASQWLGIRLQMIGVTMVTAVAFLAVLQHHFQNVDAGLVGLAITYALSVTGLLNSLVTFFTETEKQLVSMERAGQYIQDVPREKSWSTLNAPPIWPLQGSIHFLRVHLQYRSHLPHALNGVCFETQPAEKIGIVGRTGSGKSSLFTGLFRLVELHSGSITIDGINIYHLPLRELRSKLAIIPQDPFLFSGTVKENLDPVGEHYDQDLWTVLERCHLKVTVERLGGLHADVAERGRHFSVGQRQLICLARALLTKAKILCIDEATASVDQETDSLIQATIRQEFAGNTVLTIAHRIKTIRDSDRVLVMDNGTVAEFDKPDVLLARPSSLFYSLYHGQ